MSVSAVKALIVFLFFTAGILAGYSPPAGVVLSAAIAFCIVFYLKPTFFVHLYILLVSLSGLVTLPITDGGFSSAVAVTLPAFILTAFGLLVARDRRLVLIPLGRVDQALPLLFFAVMLISLISSRSLKISSLQIQQYIYILAIYYFLLYIISDRRTLRTAHLILVVSGFLAGCAGLFELLMQGPVYYFTGNKSLLGADLSHSFVDFKAGRVTGPIADGPFHGVFMMMVGVSALYYVFQSRHRTGRLCAVGVLLLSVINILGTGSRGAFGSFVVALGVFLLLADIRHKVPIILSLGGAGATLAVLMVLIFPEMNVTRSYTYQSESRGSAEMRVENAPVALRIFADYPLIGSGPDGFVINYTKYARGVSPLAFREKILKTHNTPLQVLAEYGLIGFAVFFGFILLVLRRVWSARRLAATPADRMLAVSFLSVLIAYCFFMLTSNTLLDRYFWLVIVFGQLHHTFISSESEVGDADIRLAQA